MVLLNEKQPVNDECGQWLDFRRVFFLLLFTLVCHAIHLWRYPFPARDALTYLHILHEWNDCGSFAQILEEFPKFGLLLFPFLPLRWTGFSGMPLYWASVVWMMFMSMVSVYACYKIILLLTGDAKKAMWCGALLAVHPAIMLHAGNLLRDTPYLMFALLHVLCMIYALRTRKWYSMLFSGITLAMCALSRFEAWELLVLSPVFAVFYCRKRQWKTGDVFRWVLWAAGGFLSVIVVMLGTIDDLPRWFEKWKFVFLYYIPDWMELK